MTYIKVGGGYCLLTKNEKSITILKPFRIMEKSSTCYRQQAVDIWDIGITFETGSYFSFFFRKIRRWWCLI
jgi:hypothetical protein